jgi:hypothetical protein
LCCAAQKDTQDINKTTLLIRPEASPVEQPAEDFFKKIVLDGVADGVAVGVADGVADGGADGAIIFIQKS